MDRRVLQKLMSQNDVSQTNYLHVYDDKELQFGKVRRQRLVCIEMKFGVKCTYVFKSVSIKAKIFHSK